MNEPYQPKTVDRIWGVALRSMLTNIVFYVSTSALVNRVENRKPCKSAFVVKSLVIYTIGLGDNMFRIRVPRVQTG